jgi:hypothetical protein
MSAPNASKTTNANGHAATLPPEQAAQDAGSQNDSDEDQDQDQIVMGGEDMGGMGGIDFDKMIGDLRQARDKED